MEDFKKSEMERYKQAFHQPLELPDGTISHYPNLKETALDKDFQSFLQEHDARLIKRLEGEVEKMNNFRQAKVDGKDDWNNALEQSACKVDAFIQTFLRGK